MDSKRMLSGSSVAAMMNPRRAEQQRRRKARLGKDDGSRDFVRSNARAAQEIARRREEALRARAAAKEREEHSGRWKMDKFKDVQPKLGRKGLKSGAGRHSPAEARDQQSPKPFLHRVSKSGAEIESSPPPARYERPVSSPRKPGVPRAGDALPAPKRPQRDIIRENAVGTIRGEAAALAPSARARAAAARRGAPKQSRGGFGEVPGYLKARQERWAREEAEAEMARGDPGCPEGMRKVPDGERRETLELLRVRLGEAQGDLARAPRGADSISARRFRKGLEDRIEELEEAIAVFSKKDVLVEDPESKRVAMDKEEKEAARRPLEAVRRGGARGPRGAKGAVSSRGAGAGGRTAGKGGREVQPRVPSHRVGAAGRRAGAGGASGAARGARRGARGGRSRAAEDKEEEVEEDFGPVISNVPAGVF